MPKIFDRENQNKSPVSALVTTALLMTIMIFIVILANDVYLAAIFYAVGIPFYYAARKEDLKTGKLVFTKLERILAFLIVIAAAAAILFMMEGKLQP